MLFVYAYWIAFSYQSRLDAWQVAVIAWDSKWCSELFTKKSREKVP